MRIILIHIGKTIPDYVLSNLKHVSDVFREELVFVSDNHNALDRARKLGNLTCIHTDELGPLALELERNLLSGDKLLRASILRFEILKEVIRKLQCRVVYLESDVLIFRNFPIQEFVKIENELAYPLVSNGEGIASVFFVKDLDACSRMIDFFTLELSENGFLTDMQLLWKYKYQYPERVLVLPTTLQDFSQESKDMRIDFLSEVQLKSDFFSGVFDSATWGQFLTGEHEVNSLGFRPLFHVQKHHLVEPWRHGIEIDKEGSIKISLNGSCAPLFCLHVHSKDMAFFGSDKLLNLQECIGQSKYGMRFKFFLSIRNFTNLKGGVRNLFTLIGDRMRTNPRNEL